MFVSLSVPIVSYPYTGWDVVIDVHGTIQNMSYNHEYVTYTLDIP
jgi:hypothetical protein